MRLPVLFFCLLAAPALAAKPPLFFTYAVYGGGLHVVDASLQLTEGGDRYEARVKARTQGTLGRLAPWSSLLVSEGWTGKAAWRPSVHRFTTRWRDDAKTTHLRYNPEGRIISRTVTEQGHPDDTKNADPALAKGAMDLATGILNFLRHRSMRDGCEGRFPVYDGKRRFDIIMARQQSENLTATRYNRFSGKAISCTVEIKPAGGDWGKENRGWFKIQEDSRARGRLPRVTVAELPGVAGWLVPVRLDVASPYGAFIMHLTGTGKAVK